MEAHKNGNPVTPKESTANEKESAASKFTVKAIIAEPIQLVFFIFLVFIILILVPFTYVSYYYIKKSMAEAPPGYDFPKVSDFRASIVVACVFASLQHLSTVYIGPLWKNLCKDQDDEVKLKLKMEKSGKYTFSFCYMLGITIFAYSILKDQDLMFKHNYVIIKVSM